MLGHADGSSHCAAGGARRQRYSSVEMSAARSSGGLQRVGVFSRLVVVVVASILCRGSLASVGASDMSAGPAAYLQWPVPRPSFDGQGAAAQPGVTNKRRAQKVLQGTGKNLASVYKSSQSFFQGAAGGAIGNPQNHPCLHIFTTCALRPLPPPLFPPPALKNLPPRCPPRSPPISGDLRYVSSDVSPTGEMGFRGWIEIVHCRWLVAVHTNFNRAPSVYQKYSAG